MDGIPGEAKKKKKKTFFGERLFSRVYNQRVLVDRLIRAEV